MAKGIQQHIAVIQALQRLGGIATLAQLCPEALKVEGCQWGTKTPYASIRRIVQLRPEIYKIKPGLYGLVEYRSRHQADGYVPEERASGKGAKSVAMDHAYYQGLLLSFGKMRGFDTYAPDQDKNRVWLNRTLGQIRTLTEIPQFSHPELVRRSSTIDVSWFNKQNRMPHSFYEIEMTTDIQRSLLKFLDLIDFNAAMLIVADRHRRQEFDSKLRYQAFQAIRPRVRFLDCDSLVKQYEHAAEIAKMDVVL